MYSICQHSTSIGASTNSGGIEGPATDLELRNNPPFPFPLSIPTISYAWETMYFLVGSRCR